MLARPARTTVTWAPSCASCARTALDINESSATWPSWKTSTPVRGAPRRNSSGGRYRPRGPTGWIRPARGFVWGWTGPAPAESGWAGPPALSHEQVEQCRRMAGEGAVLCQIDRVMGCSPSTVKKVVVLGTNRARLSAFQRSLAYISGQCPSCSVVDYSVDDLPRFSCLVLQASLLLRASAASSSQTRPSELLVRPSAWTRAVRSSSQVTRAPGGCPGSARLGSPDSFLRSRTC